jgi:hypothetical protein
MDRMQRQKSLLNLNADAAAQDGKLLINSMKAGDKAAFKVDGPIKVEHRNTGAHPDGIHYFLVWDPLDEQGNVMQQISNRPSSAPTVQKWVPPFNIPADEIFKPPFDNPTGWRVLIRIPAQKSRNGNSPDDVVMKVREFSGPSKDR